MALVTINQVHLPECGFPAFPLLAELRAERSRARPEICVERARLVTEYLRDLADPSDPPIVRRAGAVAHYLANKEPLFPDGNRLAGTTTSKVLGAPLYPEFGALELWPELDSLADPPKTRPALAPRDAEILNFEVFPFWMDETFEEVLRRESPDGRMPAATDRMVVSSLWSAGSVSHVVPSYRHLLQKGLRPLMEEARRDERDLRSREPLSDKEEANARYCRAIQTVLAGLIAYVERLGRKALELARFEADVEKRWSYTEMAEVCEHISDGPPMTLREALNLLWLVQIALAAENVNLGISPGRLDQILYPYYRRDLDEGRITLHTAFELIGCFWLKTGDNTVALSEAGSRLFGGVGSVPSVTLGGIDSNGEDAVNDLTYVMLRVSELLALPEPNICARFHREANSRDYFDRLCSVVLNTKALPGLYNDTAAIAALKHCGIREPHARDYAVAGGGALTTSGMSFDVPGTVMVNLAAALEMVLFNGKRTVSGDEPVGPETGEPASFSSFEMFFSAFTKQMGRLLSRAVELANAIDKVRSERFPCPLLSALLEGPTERGVDATAGGAWYNSTVVPLAGFADVADSLAAIEYTIFRSKNNTLQDLVRAIETDYHGQETLQQYLRHLAPKFGAGTPVAKKNASRFLGFLHTYLAQFSNHRGGGFRPAFWGLTAYAGLGALTGSLPNGRPKGDPLSPGITPGSGVARELGSCLAALAALDDNALCGGAALSFRITGVAPENLSKLADHILTFFGAGGLQTGIMVGSGEELIAAKIRPGKAPDLLVEINGACARFADLNDRLKNELIARTEYDLRTGHAARAAGRG